MFGKLLYLLVVLLSYRLVLLVQLVVHSGEVVASRLSVFVYVVAGNQWLVVAAGWSLGL